MDREPVKRAEKWSDMVEFRRTVDKSGSVVLDFLKFRQKIDRRARKKRVTIVETRQNKSTEKGFGSIFRQEVADGSYSSYFKITGSTDIGYVLMEGERLVEGNTEVAYS